MRAAFGQPLGMSIDRLLIFGLEFNDALYPDADGGARPRRPRRAKRWPRCPA